MVSSGKVPPRERDNPRRGPEHCQPLRSRTSSLVRSHGELSSHRSTTKAASRVTGASPVGWRLPAQCGGCRGRASRKGACSEDPSDGDLAVTVAVPAGKVRRTRGITTFLIIVAEVGISVYYFVTWRTIEKYGRDRFGPGTAGFRLKWFAQRSPDRRRSLPFRSGQRLRK